MNLLRMAAGVEDGRWNGLSQLQVPEECSGWGLYRDHTVALLRKYFRMSLDLGRVPSVLGGQLFRAKVTTYTVHTFEDVVIFVHDVERCLEKLDIESRVIIARIVLQDFSHDEAAEEFGMSRRQVVRSLGIALDKAAEILLECGLMEPLHGKDGLPPKKEVERAR